MYYFGNWICKILFLTFYPALLIVIVFPFLELKDQGNKNYFLFLRHAIIQSINATTLGHAWGAIFDNETNALVTGFAAMSFFAVGCGSLVSTKNANNFIKFVSFCSPMSYSIELYFKRILSE